MLLLMLMTLFQPEPQLTSTMTTMYLQILHELCEAKQKVMMRKRLLWQLCYKEAAQKQPLSSWLLWHPSIQLQHQYPKDFPRAQHAYQGVAPADQKEEGQWGGILNV